MPHIDERTRIARSLTRSMQERFSRSVAIFSGPRVLFIMHDGRELHTIDAGYEWDEVDLFERVSTAYVQLLIAGEE